MVLSTFYALLTCKYYSKIIVFIFLMIFINIYTMLVKRFGWFYYDFKFKTRFERLSVMKIFEKHYHSIVIKSKQLRDKNNQFLYKFYVTKKLFRTTNDLFSIGIFKRRIIFRNVRVLQMWQRNLSLTHK